MAKPLWRWTADDVLILNNSAVGNVNECTNGEYSAYGMMSDWEDTKLGLYKTKNQAKKAVEDWVMENLDE